MTQLTVPQNGLALIEAPHLKSDNDASKSGMKPMQVMELDLVDGVLEDVLRSARHGGKSVHVSFGKTITLHFGNKSRHLNAMLSPSQSQLYTSASNEKYELAFAGRVSHKLAMQKADEDIAGADEALLKLQNQLASHEKAKQSKQIKYVPNSSNLPPPVKQSAAALKHQSAKTNSLSILTKHKIPAHLDNSTTRSMPASPSLGASDTPAPKPSNPAPTLTNGRTQKFQALRTPLIHFLAARPASTKLLAEHLGCKQDEILEILQKVGKNYRLDPSKWDLVDRAFKNLDVWNFNYPSQEDRQLAINRAISAFDRMRLSVQEDLWQSLLPKHERGKGKILSHLANLNKGPIQQSTTPRIHVQEPSIESLKDGGLGGNESDQKDRLAPSDAEPMARSRSHDQIKKKKVSEKEAQSKRLLSNGPKKASPAPKVKEAHPAVKKGGKKPNAPKSSEFVKESDEEDGLEGLTNQQPRSPTLKSNGSNSKEKKATAPPHFAASTPLINETNSNNSKPVIPSKSDSAALTTKATSPKPATPSHPGGSSKYRSAVPGRVDGKATKSKEFKSGKKESTMTKKTPDQKPLPPSSVSPGGSTAMKKTLSRQRTTSSPHKPSPLGSSPPTNASDLENAMPSSTPSTPPTTRKQNATPNGAAVGHIVNGHARNTSEHSLKRKAGDLDSNIHRHGSPLTNGNVDGHTNPTKRRKSSSDGSPATSESSNSPPTRSQALEKAQRFKTFYVSYEAMYRQVSESKDAPQEEIDKVKKMHDRLISLKDEIAKGLVGI